jgi:6-pyruvoyltetrahydropterin/6-carboxytetrahydropterin synthase
MSDFHIRIAGDDLGFCAAHFITLENGQCERLHGHSYRAAVEVFGPLNDSRYVVDFTAVREAVRRILTELDHRVLLPTQHPAIRISRNGDEVEATFAARRWAFPQDDCLVLPVANTTTEALAEYIGERLTTAMKAGGVSASRLRVEIGEGTGCAAIWEMGC